MAYREYIGSRYVPIFGRKDEDSIIWDNSKPYEPLTVVTYQGNSYTSRQFVPEGTDIANEAFWALTGNYNAQIDQYRAEVARFDGRITENAEDIDALEDNIDALEGKFPIASDDIANGAVTTETIANGAVTTETIANGAVTTETIANGAVTTGTIANESITVPKLSNDTIIRFRDKYLSIAGTNLVVFGDSYTQDNITNSVNAYWAKRLNTALGTVLHNFAISGAGFGRETQLISRQQTNCTNAMSAEEAANTSIVVCMAGCNDLLNDVAIADINSGITGFITWANSFFPNADIYVIPYNWGFAKLSITRNNIITNSLNSIMTYNVARVHIIPYAWTWNLGISGRFQNEVHPNMTGYNHICAHILDAINGTSAPAFNTGSKIDLSNSSYLNSGFIEYNCREGVLYINGYVRPTSAGQQDLTIYAENKLPAILTPNDSLFVLGLYDSTIHDSVGVINFAQNGRLLVNLNSRVNANDVCCFNGSFIPEVGVDWNDYVS